MVVKVRKKMRQRSEKVDRWLDQRSAKAHARLERREAKQAQKQVSPASLGAVWPTE